MKEIFKDIPGYEGIYQVSNLCRVKSLPKFHNNRNGGYITKEKILKQSINVYGYYYVALYNGKKRITQPIHKLMAITFLEHIPCNYDFVIDHIDNNPLNNCLNNLQIISHRENISKGFKNKNITSKFTGVSWNKENKKFQVFIRINGKNRNLGSFDDENRAKIAYDLAVFQIDKLKLIFV